MPYADPVQNRKAITAWRNTPEGRASALASTNRMRLKGKKFLDDYKELHTCRRCSFSDPRALEFHHRDPSTKLFDVAARKTTGMERLMAEIAKCDVICANCHRIEHAEERERKLS